MVVPIHRDQRPEVIVPHGCWQVEKSLGQVGGVFSLGAPRLSVGIPREDSGGVNPLPTPTSKAAFISRFEIGPKTCSSDTRPSRGRRGSLRGHWGLTADQGRQTAQRLVDLSGGMKHRRHVGFEDDHIGAFRVTPRVFATHALREVVFGGHGGRGSRFA